MRYPTCQQLPWHPAHGHTCDVASPTKKPIVEVAADVKEAQATEKIIGSDMVAEGVMLIHTSHCASTLAMEFTKALEKILTIRPSLTTVEQIRELYASTFSSSRTLYTPIRWHPSVSY